MFTKFILEVQIDIKYHDMY